MFLINLSHRLCELCRAGHITYDVAAKLCGITTAHFGAIVRGRRSPSITALEQICLGLDITPDTLLLDNTEYSKEQPRKICQVIQFQTLMHPTEYPVCPRCSTTLEREYQRYCDRCGQRLDWHALDRAEVIVK